MIERYPHPRTVWTALVDTGRPDAASPHTSHTHRRWFEYPPAPPYATESRTYRIIHKLKIVPDMEVIYLEPWCVSCERSTNSHPRLWALDDPWGKCADYARLCRAHSIAYVRIR